MNRLMFVISMYKQDISADARIFPHLGDKISYLYVEHCRIEQEDSSIVLLQKGTRTPIPIGVIACLICGPGTTVTHRAIQACGDNQTLLVWSGEQMRTFYASGMYENKSSQNLLRQIDIDNAPETLSTGIWDNVITYQEFQSKTLWGQKNTI